MRRSDYGFVKKGVEEKVKMVIIVPSTRDGDWGDTSI
jgi:hypothetical protein